MKVCNRSLIFLFLIGLFTLVSSVLIAGMIDFSASNLAVAIFWMVGFVVATWHIGYLLTISFFSLLYKDSPLKEHPPLLFPPTAILYVVRNEDVKVLCDKMHQSFQNNFGDNIDLWLLSNSDAPAKILQEHQIVQWLGTRFGLNRVHYFKTENNPLRRKHVCIREWSTGHPEYTYFAVCDADSVLSAGAIGKLVAKAEHPENRDVVLFQTHISVSHHPTYFVKLLGFGQDICQRIYGKTIQKIFGRAVSYGSGCLIRRSEFNQIEVPDWVLSHDIWETALLDAQHYRVVFCYDIVTYGGFPLNYIEDMRRSQRWINGTLESTHVVCREKLSLETRCLVLLPIYMYLKQPLLCIWMMSGFFYDYKMWHPLLVTQRYAFLLGNSVHLEMGFHFYLTLCIVIGHRFLKCKGLKETSQLFAELVVSFLICLNNIVFDSLAVIRWFLFSKRGMPWVPMQKNDDQQVTLIDATKKLWPTTVIGFIGLVVGWVYSPNWALAAFPFLCSFSLGIPMAYMTAKRAT